MDEEVFPDQDQGFDLEVVLEGMEVEQYTCGNSSFPYSSNQQRIPVQSTLSNLDNGFFYNLVVRCSHKYTDTL